MRAIKKIFAVVLLLTVTNSLAAQEDKSVNLEEPTVFKKPAPVILNTQNISSNEQVGTWERTKNPNHKTFEQTIRKEEEQPTAERRKAPPKS